MLVPFETLPLESRIWIYQSNRKLSDDEISSIELQCNDFVSNWAAHGTPLEASFLLKYNRFVIFAINHEIQAPTGCSIDKSVEFIQNLEKQFNIDLLDKMNVTFKNGEFIAHKTLLEFKQMVKNKAVTSQTIVFNNLANTIAELETNWEVPAEESWHSRFF